MKRRKTTTNDCEIGVKCTCDEKDKLKAISLKLDKTMSEIVRIAVNKYFDKQIFDR